MRASRRRQSAIRSSMMRNMRGKSTSVRVARIAGNSARRECRPCRTAMPRSSRNARICDDAGTLTDQSLADAVQRLKVELIGGLGRDEFHGRALHSLADGFRISEVILLSLRIGTHVFRRHQAGVVAKHLEFAAEMMGADAGFHTDQAWWQVGEPRFHLAA